MAYPIRSPKAIGVVRKHPDYSFLIFLAALVMVVAYLYFYSKGLTNVYPDGNSKMAHARRVFDNYTGEFKLANLGLVWLWGQSLLILPTVWNDWMYKTGMSGSIVSMASFAACVVFVYEIVRTLTGSRFGSLAASAVTLTTLNLIYFGTTPMTEPQIIASIALCALSLIKVEQSVHAGGTESKWLTIASLSLGVAVYVRYDMWYLIVGAIPLIGIVMLTKNIRGAELVAKMGQLFIVPLFGILLWLFWQFLQTKDPLYFSHGPYSAKEKDVVVLGQNDSVGNITESINQYLGAVRWNFDDKILLIALCGVALYLVRFLLRKETLISPLFLGGIVLFNIQSLFTGQSAIVAEKERMLNIRYGLTIIVLVTVGYAYVPALMCASKNRILKFTGRGLTVLAIGLCVFSLYPQLQEPVANTTVLSGYLSDERQARLEMADYIVEHYDGGDILIDIIVPSAEPLLYETGLDQSEFLTETYPLLWQQALSEPLYFTDWIFVFAQGDRVGHAIARTPDFSSYYSVAYANDVGTLYLRHDKWRKRL